jgi:hypothetical protein
MKHLLLLPLRFADLCSEQWTAQNRANIAKVECPGAQGKHTPRHGDHAKGVIPEQITSDKKSHAGYQAKNPTSHAIDESRKPRLIESFSNVHIVPPCVPYSHSIKVSS